jgi:glutathione S-transferase
LGAGPYSIVVGRARQNSSVGIEVSDGSIDLKLPSDEPNRSVNVRNTTIDAADPLLFYAPGACSFAAHITLEEIGRKFSLQKVLTDKGETRTEAFMRLNPKGRVPVLIRGSSTLTELPAILLHLGIDEPALAPKGPEELVRAVEWMNWLSGTVHACAVRQIWRPEYFADDIGAHEAIRLKGREHLGVAFGQVEERLPLRSWIMPSGYTHLDPFLLVYYRWGNRLGCSMRDTYPKWTWHAEQMAQREPVIRALATEEISIWH